MIGNDERSYIDNEKVYGPESYAAGDGFTNAQGFSFFLSVFWERPLNPPLTAFLNLVETALNIAYLYLAHVVQWQPAAVIGFGAVVMTLSKTVLYWVQEYFCGFCKIGHNSFKDIFVLWIVPNGYGFLLPPALAFSLINPADFGSSYPRWWCIVWEKILLRLSVILRREL